MENVLKITDEWDFDGLWSRCDDIFVVLVSLLLIGLGFFIAKNDDNHTVHHIHHGVRHTVSGPPELPTTPIKEPEAEPEPEGHRITEPDKKED
jgi:hypothetical protein